MVEEWNNHGGGVEQWMVLHWNIRWWNSRTVDGGKVEQKWLNSRTHDGGAVEQSW